MFKTYHFRKQRKKIINKMKKNIFNKGKYENNLEELIDIYEKYKLGRNIYKTIDDVKLNLNEYLMKNDMKPLSEIEDEKMFNELIILKFEELKEDLKKFKKEMRSEIEKTAYKVIKNKIQTKNQDHVKKSRAKVVVQ